MIEIPLYRYLSNMCAHSYPKEENKNVHRVAHKLNALIALSSNTLLPYIVFPQKFKSPVSFNFTYQVSVFLNKTLKYSFCQD